MKRQRWLVAGALLMGGGLSPGCYAGFGAGPTHPLNQPGAANGADSMTELGFVVDYKRFVRVMYSRSLQLYGGAMFTTPGGSHVVAPLQNTVELTATVHTWPTEVYLRAMARAYWGSGVRVGPEGDEVQAEPSLSRGALLGGTFLFAGDHERLGPTGLSLSMGLLIAQAETASIGRVTYLAPMVFIGVDFFPPSLVNCLFVDDTCPHHLKLAKN